LEEILLAAGIPSAICGLLVWLLKRSIDKREKHREEREKRIEDLILLNLQTGRTTTVLAVATAKAVQRIPDARCNGDMIAALETAATLQGKEKDFLIKNGVERIFGE